MMEKDRSEDDETYLKGAQSHHDLGQSQSKVACTAERVVRQMGLSSPLYLVDRRMEDEQDDVESRENTHSKDLSLFCVDQDRIAPALNGVDGYLTDAVEAQVLEMKTHIGMKLQEEAVEEVLEIADYSTILCAGVSGRVAHCQPYWSRKTLKRTQQ
jgi:hypothetical protein